MKGLTRSGHEDWRTTELVLAYVSVVFGLWMLLQGGAIGSSHHYPVLTALPLSLIIFGSVLVAIGVLKAWAAYTRHHALRYWMSFAATVIWSAVCLLILAGEPDSITGWLGVGFAVASAFAFVAGAHCEVVGGRCNGTLEHRVSVLAQRVVERNERRERDWRPLRGHAARPGDR